MADDQRISDGEGLGAEAIINALGGIRPAAAKLAIPVTTVQGWKNRGRIPENRREEIETAILELGVEVSLQSPAIEPKSETQVCHDRSKLVSNQSSAPKSEQANGATTVQTQSDFGNGQVAFARGAGGLAILALLLSFATAVFVTIFMLHPGLFSTSPDGTAGVDKGAFEKLSDESDRRFLETSRLLSTGQIDQEKLVKKLRSLEARFDALSKKIETVGFAGEEVVEGHLKQLNGSVEGLRKQTAEIRGQFQKLLAQEIDELFEMTRRLKASSITSEARIEGLEKQQNAVRSRIQTLQEGSNAKFDKDFALLVSVGQLEWVALSGREFDNAFERVRYLADDRPGLVKILEGFGSKWQQMPVSDRALADGFDNVKSKLAGGRTPPDGWGIWEGAWAQVKSIIGLRRLGPESESLVTKIERALISSEFKTILDMTEGFGREVDVWRQSVEQRLLLEELLAQFNKIILGAPKGDVSPGKVSSHSRRGK